MLEQMLNELEEQYNMSEYECGESTVSTIGSRYIHWCKPLREFPPRTSMEISGDGWYAYVSISGDAAGYTLYAQYVDHPYCCQYADERVFPVSTIEQWTRFKKEVLEVWIQQGLKHEDEARSEELTDDEMEN